MSNSDKLYLGCPVQFTRQFISGKWQMGILWSIKDKSLRFYEIKKQLPEISDKSLNKELDYFLSKKIILKRNDSSVLFHPSYALTEFGKSLIPLISQIVEWGYVHLQDEKINQAMDSTPSTIINEIEASFKIDLKT